MGMRISYCNFIISTSSRTLRANDGRLFTPIIFMTCSQPTYSLVLAGTHANIMTEYFPLGSLDKYIKEGMKENDARIISLQLLEGLRLMHEEGFTHRDLKPQVSSPS